MMQRFLNDFPLISVAAVICKIKYIILKIYYLVCCCLCLDVSTNTTTIIICWLRHVCVGIPESFLICLNIFLSVNADQMVSMTGHRYTFNCASLCRELVQLRIFNFLSLMQVQCFQFSVEKCVHCLRKIMHYKINYRKFKHPSAN